MTKSSEETSASSCLIHKYYRLCYYMSVFFICGRYCGKGFSSRINVGLFPDFIDNIKILNTSCYWMSLVELKYSGFFLKPVMGFFAPSAYAYSVIFLPTVE